MQKLSLRDWASVAEIIGTAAVVVSLLLLVSSLDRNSAVVSGDKADELYDAVLQIDLSVVNNAELSALISRAEHDLDSLTPEETDRYIQWLTLYLDTWERMDARQRVGLIQDETMTGWHEWFGEWAQRHMSRPLWDRIEWNYMNEGPYSYFHKRVDALFPKPKIEVVD
jgi:hypothetical protein